MLDSNAFAEELRRRGYPEEYVAQCLEEHEIALEMVAIGERIAHIAHRVKQWGGDHDYDGIINYVWQGIHQAHGVEDTECGIHWPSSDCPLDAGFERRATAKPKRKKLSTSQSLEVFAKDDYTCQHCGSRKNLTVDHIVPVVKGGTNDPDNLQTLCGSCNSRKGAR